MNADDLIRDYVDADADEVPDGRAEARLRDYGIPIWALVGQWQALDQDAEEVAREYQIPLEAVEAALAYYRRYKKYIDARLLLNTA